MQTTTTLSLHASKTLADEVDRLARLTGTSRSATLETLVLSGLAKGRPAPVPRRSKHLTKTEFGYLVEDVRDVLRLSESPDPAIREGARDLRKALISTLDALIEEETR